MSDRPITLFSPGPVPMSEISLKIMGTPPIHHRSKSFAQSLKNAHCSLSGLLGTPHCLAFTSTGSGGLESSIVNTLSNTDKALCIEGGKFGERWKEILKAYGVKHDFISFKWGKTPPLDQIKEQLLTNKYKAVFIQACETSTGTRYSIKEISKLIKDFSPESLLVVDGITAVGAYPISVADDQIDVLITGSQKALSLATGMSFVGLSDKALKACERSNLPKYYFNYLEELKCLKNGTTRFSSPTQLWLCLEEELKSFNNLEEKHNHTLRLQKMMIDWCRQEGLELFSSNPSPSLTAVYCPKDISLSDLRTEILNQGYFIAGGQGEYTNSLFRVGHMGHISLSLMEDFLKVFSKVLKKLRDRRD